MVRRESIKWQFYVLLSLISIQSFGNSDNKATQLLLMQVNKNWANLTHEIEHTFKPNSEQTLVQLHLLNVVSYLERQPVNTLTKRQQENRRSNIDILRKYSHRGAFPKNTITSDRKPIFIDANNTHCAVGYLLKENGLQNAAQEIAKNQMLFYLENIEHPSLTTWQKNCGLSLFELALIQPTYKYETSTEIDPPIDISDPIMETHELLIKVNKIWTCLNTEIQHTFTPNSEQALVQLHLLNVVSYLECQPVFKLTKRQKENRRLNIDILRKYSLRGAFPINNVTPFRTPIFIDASNTYCAVGYLLKENGLQIAAQEIAENQLLYYVEDIEHPPLTTWQKDCGLSLFELALIQPTYGPPIPVCVTPSPIHWNIVNASALNFTQLFSNKDNTAIYGISQIDDLGMKQEIKAYSPKTQQWSVVGTQITGQTLDLAFCDNQIFISVFLPDKDYPHQLLKLNGNGWEKIAHFNGSINTIQSLHNKLYVLGSFKMVNDSITTNLVVIEGESIRPFNPTGLRNTSFDHMKSSKTALFLTQYGEIYKCQNDTIKRLTSIQHYQYISSIQLDAQADTLFVSSIDLRGYNRYFDGGERSFYMNNMLYGQDSPYQPIGFTKSKLVNGKMIFSGDFKSSTMEHQINDERYPTPCEASESAHWYGGGLLYSHENKYYPIVKEGVVLDFVELNNRLYILKKDGSLSYAALDEIEKEVDKMKKRTLELK